MKKIIILFILLIAANAHAAGVATFGCLAGASAAAGSCDDAVAKDSSTSTAGGFMLIGNQSATKNMGSRFTTGSAYSLCTVTVKLKLDSSSDPSWTITAYIFSDGTTAPSALVATSSNTVSTSTLTTSYSDVSFTFDPVALNGTYWLVIGVSANGANCIAWGKANTGTGTTAYSADRASWTGLGTSMGAYATTGY